MKKYLIHTQDVDGETKDVYDDQAKAVARFEEMYGYPIQNAIEEKYWLLDTPPTIETLHYVDAVSNFGTVVAYEVLEGSEQPVTKGNRMTYADNVKDWEANHPTAHITIGRFTLVYAWLPYAGWAGSGPAWEEVACPDGFDDSPEDQWLCHLHETDIVKSKWTDVEFIDDTLEALRSNPFQEESK